MYTTSFAIYIYILYVHDLGCLQIGCSSITYSKYTVNTSKHVYIEIRMYAC